VKTTKVNKKALLTLGKTKECS